MTHPEYMFSEMDMQASQALVDHFHSLDDGARQCFLREFQQPLDQSLATFMLSVVTSDRDDDVRIEAAKILGLYRGDYDDAFIRNALIQLINAGDSEDDSLIVNCIHSLALLDLGADEIDFALSIIEQERYVLFQSAAFSLLEQNRRLPAAWAALERLVDNRSYGRAARRALERVQLEDKP